jgi:hypothetical protein
MNMSGWRKGWLRGKYVAQCQHSFERFECGVRAAESVLVGTPSYFVEHAESALVITPSFFAQIAY